jgi:hypothetical protein
MGWIAMFLEDGVQADRKILEGVEQGAVEIEDYSLERAGEFMGHEIIVLV